MRRIDTKAALSKLTNLIEKRIADDHSAPSDTLAAVEKIEAADPTRNKRYSVWLLQTWLRGGIRYLEDLPRARQALTTFDKFKRRLPEDQRDINRAKRLSDLEEVVAPFIEQKTSREIKAEDRARAYDESEIMYDGPEGMIVIPQTEFASCFWGRGTKWCTAFTDAENAFDRYHRSGPLYTLIAKDGTKSQFHLETSQYMDEEDKHWSLPYLEENSALYRIWREMIAPRLTSDPERSFYFAIDVLDGPFREAEKVLASSQRAVDYAWLCLRGRFPQAESHIAQDPLLAFTYAQKVIRGRWPQGEEAIMRNSEILRKYLYDIVKGPMPEAEHIIAQHPDLEEEYQILFQAREPLEEEKPKSASSGFAFA